MKNKQIVLNSLKLENTGLHKNFEIEFGKVTVVESKNANGKTTIENSISALIEGKYKNLVNNQSEHGKITGLFSDNISVVLSLHKDKKESPTIIENSEIVKKPRAILDSWNPKSLRVDDFFKGSGVELKKRQIETLLKIIKIDLPEKTIMDICGEVINKEDLVLLHPLNYLKSLTNTKDGYYYAERAKNTVQIQTLNHSADGLRNRIIEVLDKYGIDYDKFDPSEYEDISITELSRKINDAQHENTKYVSYQTFIKEYDVKLKEKQDLAKKYIDDKIVEFTGDHEDEIKEKEIEFIESMKKELKFFFKEDITLDEFENAVISHFNNLKSTFDTWQKNTHSQLELIRKPADVDKMIKPLQEALDAKIDNFKKSKEVADKYIEENELIDIDKLLEQSKKVEDLQKIIPVFKEQKKLLADHEDKKELSEKYTEIIDELRTLPQKLLSTAKIPIKNLTMDKDGEFVYKNEHKQLVSLDQLSEWEQIRISYDISIANMGKINLLIIPKWSEIDPDNQKYTINYFIKKGVNLLAIGISGDEDIKVTKYDTEIE